jgi:Fic family protein
MNPEKYLNSSAGVCRKTPEGYYAFYPNKLPPLLEPDWATTGLLVEAAQAMAELSGLGSLLPNPHLLIQPYLRREAIFSSRIENTITDMEQLALFEIKPTPKGHQISNTHEVMNHLRALQTGLEKINNLPISSRLICELHHILLQGVRGGEATKTPGEFRRSPNWIGPPGATLNEATFVPPPPSEVSRLLGEWENYLHEDSQTPELVKCAWLHYQFETIHPFLDGNGRIGRLLITLYLCSKKCLSQPLLYLSGFFDDTRDDYFRILLGVSQDGNWRAWLEYFLRGVRRQAKMAIVDTNNILTLYKKYREILRDSNRAPSLAAKVLDHIFANPYISVSYFQYFVQGSSYHNVNKAVKFWATKGLLHEATGQKRNRFFVARELLNAMSRHPEPAPTISPAPDLGGGVTA